MAAGNLKRMCALSCVQALPGWGDGTIITIITVMLNAYFFVHTMYLDF